MEKYIDILSTYNQADIAIIKSILGEEEIDYYFKGENFSVIDPLIQPAVLTVRESQAGIVRELLKDLKLTYIGVSLRNDDDND